MPLYDVTLDDGSVTQIELDHEPSVEEASSLLTQQKYSAPSVPSFTPEAPPSFMPETAPTVTSPLKPWTRDIFDRDREAAEYRAFLASKPGPLQRWGRGAADVAWNLPRLAAQGLGLGEKGLMALTGQAVGTGDTLEDVGRAVFEAKPMPVEQAVESLPRRTLRRYAAQAGLGLVSAVPDIALLMGTGGGATPLMIKGGVKTLLTKQGVKAALPQMIAAGGLFGTDAQGNFHPREAVTGALMMPFMGAAHVKSAQLLAKALNTSDSALLGSTGVQKLLDLVGSQAALNAYTMVADSPELISEARNDPAAFWDHMAQMVGNNLAFGLFHVKDINPRRMSGVQRFVMANGDKYAKAYAGLLDKVNLPDVQARRNAILNSWTDIVRRTGLYDEMRLSPELERRAARTRGAFSEFGTRVISPEDLGLPSSTRAGRLTLGVPVEKGAEYATERGTVAPEGKLPRVEAREAVPPDVAEVRKEEGAQADDRNRLERGGVVAQPEEAAAVVALKQPAPIPLAEKQPWQMTKAEYQAAPLYEITQRVAPGEVTGVGNMSVTTVKGKGAADLLVGGLRSNQPNRPVTVKELPPDNSLSGHEQAVRDAIELGKEVPQEVLAEYGIKPPAPPAEQPAVAGVPVGVPEPAVAAVPSTKGGEINAEERMQRQGQGPVGPFAQRAIPALASRIADLQNLLIDSDAFGRSEFYDGTYPIPQQGGIVAARSTNRYQTDPRYAAKIDAAIEDITGTIVAANRQRLALIGRPGTGVFGVDYSVEKVRATYTVNVVRAWHNEAKQKYPYTHRLGNVSVREAFQNSLDAVMAALEKGEIRQGEIKIDVERYDNKGFRVDDNGVGMSDSDIGSKFLSLHSTGKAVEGRFGGFGIAKAVILGPSDTATWRLTTRDNFFTHEMAQNNEVVGTTPRRQGTEIEVTTTEYVIDDDAKRYVESTELPKNVTVTFDGNAVSFPFKRLKPEREHVEVNDTTSYDMAYYPNAPSGYNQKYIIRLNDAKTGAKLTQAIIDVGNSGFEGTVIVDITTKALPGTEEYPLVDSRMEMKWGASKPVQKLIEGKSIDPLTAKRGKVEYTFQPVEQRPEWSETIGKIEQGDAGYQKVLDVISDVWQTTGKFFGSSPDRAITPLKELQVKIDTGYKGYRGGAMFQAKHLAAYEAVARLMSFHAGAPVSRFYPMLARVVNGIGRNAEHETGGGMGLNFISIDKTAIKNPASYALYLRDLVAHELTHEYYSPHNEEFTSKEIEIQRQTSHLFPEILRIAEAVLGTEADFGKKIVEKVVEKPVEVRIEVPVEKRILVEKYLTPQQLEFIYEHAERQATGPAKDELYYPRSEPTGDLWAQRERPDQRPAGLGGAAEGAGVGRGPEQPGPSGTIGAEPGSVGVGGVGPQAKPEPVAAAPYAVRYYVTSTGQGRGGWIVRMVMSDATSREYQSRIQTKNEAKEIKERGNEELKEKGQYRSLEEEAAQQAEAPPPPAEPAETRTNAEILSQASDVRVALNNATAIRVTFANERTGKESSRVFTKSEIKNNFEKGNTWRGQRITNVEAGTIGSKDQFIPGGEVTITDTGKKRDLMLGGLAITPLDIPTRITIPDLDRMLSQAASEKMPADLIRYLENVRDVYRLEEIIRRIEKKHESDINTARREDFKRGEFGNHSSQEMALAQMNREIQKYRDLLQDITARFDEEDLGIIRDAGDLLNLSIPTLRPELKHWQVPIAKLTRFMEETRKAMLRAQEPSRRAITMGEPVKLDTADDIRRALDDPASMINRDHRKFFRWMLDQGLLEKYPGLRFEIVDEIRRGLQSDVEPVGEHVDNVARFLRWTDSETPLHEFLHHIERWLAPEDRAWLEQERLLYLREKAPQLGDTLQSGMTSDQFMASGLSRDLYHLSNASEFFAWMMTERGLRDINRPEATTFTGKVRRMISDLWQAVKSALGLTGKEDALWRHILEGRMEYRPEQGMRFDQQRQLSLKNALEMFPEKRLESEEEARRAIEAEQPGAGIVAAKPIVRAAIDRIAAAANVSGRLTDMAARWQRDIAKRVYSDPVTRSLRVDWGRLEESANLIGGSLKTFEELRADPNTPRELVEKAAGNTLAGLAQWETRKSKFYTTYAKRRAELERQVKAAFDPEAKALEKADFANTLLEDFIDIGRTFVRQTTDQATINAYLGALRVRESTANVLNFIARNNIDLTGAVLPVQIRERMETAAGFRTNTADFAQAVGAGEEAVNTVVRLLAESEQLRDRLIEAQEVARNISVKAPTKEIKEEIAAELTAGNYERALELLGRGIRDASAERALAKYRANFYARRTRSALAGIAALDQVRDLIRSIEADPDFLGERRSAMDYLWVREIMGKQDKNGSGFILKPLKEGDEPLEITDSNSPSVQNEVLAKVLDYWNRAREIIAEFESNPNSTTPPDKVQGLKAALPLIEMQLDPAYNPAAPRQLPSQFALWLPRQFLRIFRRPEITPYWAAQGGTGPAFARVDAAGAAYRDMMEQHPKLLKKHAQALKRAQADALDSHPGLNTETWRVKVWNHLVASRQDFMDLNQLREGMAIGNGETVTPADMEYLRVYRSFEKEARDHTNNVANSRFQTFKHILTAGVLFDEQGKVRLPFSTGPDTVTRHIPNDDIPNIVKKWQEAKTIADKIAILNSEPDRLVLSYVRGIFSTDWRAKKTYKYLTELRKIASEWREKPLKDFDDLAERAYDFYLKSIPEGKTPPTFADFRSDLLYEFDSMIERIRTYGAQPEGADAKMTYNVYGGASSINTPRGNLIMPPGWYNYGGITDGEWGGMLRQMTLPFQLEYLHSVDAAIRALQGTVNEFKTQAKRNPSSKIVSESKRQRVAGELAYSYSDAVALLEEMTRLAEGLNASIREAPRLVPSDRTYMVATNGTWQLAVSSVLAAWHTMWRNLGGYRQAVRFDHQLRSHNNFRALAERGLQAFPIAYRETLRLLSQVGSPNGRRLYDVMKNASTKPIVGDMVQFFLKTIEHQRDQTLRAQSLGLSLNVNMWNNILAMWRFPETGGVIRYDPFQSIVSKGAGYFSTGTRSAAEAIGQGGVGYVDSFLNRLAIDSASDLVMDYMMMAVKYGKGVEAIAQAEGRDPFDWTDARNQIPNKALGGDKRALLVRDFFRRSGGVNIDRKMMQFYREYQAAQLREQQEGAQPGTYTKQVQMFTSEEMNSIIIATADRMNAATWANRPIVTKTTKTAQFLGMFLGYRAWMYHNLMETFNLNSRKSGAKAWMDNLPFLLAGAAALAITGIFIDEGYEQIKNRLLGKYSAYPTILKARSPEAAARSVVASMATEMPIYGDMLWAGFDLGYQRGFNLESQLFAFGIANDVFNWGKEMAQSGAVAMPTLRMLSRYTFPLNVTAQFLPQMAGARELTNTRNLLESAVRAQGDEDVLKDRPTVMERKYTGATPLVNRAVNAIGQGDLETLQSAYSELVRMKADEGDTNPEQTVRKLIAARNPVANVFKKRPTTDELSRYLAGLPDDQRARVQDVLQKFDRGMASIGGTAAFTQEDIVANRAMARGGGGGGFGPVSMAVGGLTPYRGGGRLTLGGFGRMAGLATAGRAAYRLPAVRRFGRGRLLGGLRGLRRATKARKLVIGRIRRRSGRILASLRRRTMRRLSLV